MPKKIHVYLDDMRPCPKGFVPAKNMEECLTLLKECEVGILSLDHDLGWNQPNGFELVQRMTEQQLYPEVIYIHTSSSIGRRNMFDWLYKHKPEHVKLHNRELPQEVLEEVKKSHSGDRP
jgi:hypothetical protein